MTRWPDTDHSRTPEGWDWPSGILRPIGEGNPIGAARAPSHEAEEILAQAEGWWDCTSGFRSGDRVLRNRGLAGSQMDMRLGSSDTVANSNDPKFLDPEVLGYVWNSGTGGNAIQVQHYAALNTVDIDIRMHVAFDSFPFTQAYVAAKYITAGQRCWYISADTSGRFGFSYSQDGTSTLNLSFATAPSLQSGHPAWIRIVVDNDDGTGVYRAYLYTAPSQPDEPSSWTQVGSTVVGAATASIFAGTSNLTVGAQIASGGAPARWYRYIQKDSIDGATLIDINCDRVTRSGQRSFLTDAGQRVAVTLVSSGRKNVVMPSASWRKVDDAHLFSASTSNYCQIPDENALDITGDIDLRADVAPSTLAPGATMRALAKYGGGGARSYSLYMSSTGFIGVQYTTNGTTSISQTSTLSLPTVTQANERIWIRATVDVDNGAGGTDFKFYYSYDNVTWTQLGTTVTTAGTTSFGVTAAPLAIGAASDGTQVWAGKIYRAQVYNGINGTLVADVSFENANPNHGNPTQEFICATGQTVTLTINRGTLAKVVGEKWGHGDPIMLLGADDYMQVPSSGKPSASKLTQSDSFTALVVCLWHTDTDLGTRVMLGRLNSSSGAGWIMARSNNSENVYLNVADQNGNSSSSGSTSRNYVASYRFAAFGTIDRAKRAIIAYTNTTPTTGGASAISSGNATGDQALTIGSYSNAPTFSCAMEFTAAAIWHRPLTEREIKIISDYYQQGA